MKMINLSVLLFGIVLCSAGKIPQIPANNQAQYFVLTNDGGYKYGYDTGSGSFGKQSGSSDNQVEGRFAYNVDGKLIDVTYTAGVQGYVPNTQGLSQQPTGVLGGVLNKAASVSRLADEDGPSDGSYSFSYNTGDSQRQESSDAAGNVMGRYAYSNEAGQHDLSYEAGAEKGFVVTGGSLSLPNGLAGKSSSWSAKSVPSAPAASWSGNVIPKSNNDEASINNDGSYSFSYNAGDSSRQESADAAGNVMGRYSFNNEAGQHDLSYEAGAEKGFVVTGGSLSLPNGLSGKSTSWTSKTVPSAPVASWSGNAQSVIPKSGNDEASINQDGSYSFAYNTGDSSRQESADAAGNVMGRYSFNNEAGQHDLSYEAGAEKGFVVTGGSLSLPNGLAGKSSTWSAKTAPAAAPSSSWNGQSAKLGAWSPKSGSDEATINADGSYQFAYNTGDTSRQESAAPNGDVRGSYSFTNEAGQHDLSYEAGAEKGFVVTGGNLAQPGSASLKTVSPQTWNTKSASTWTAPASVSAPAIANGDESGSAAHSFSYSTGQQAHQETGDDSGRVQGKYSYVDAAGQHDLSYTAGGDDGFIVTGGSLAKPTTNAGSVVATRTENVAQWHSAAPQVESSASGDGTYSFEYKDENSARKEASDAAGNVRGSYSYTNDAGQHDLSYEAGADKGFVVTGGSLADPSKIPPGAGSGAWKSSAQQSIVKSTGAGAPNFRLSNPNDGSYEFSYSAGDSDRQESSDASGNVQGRYQFTNEAGNHDLSYEAGAEKGFIVTGGSLSLPNGLAGKTVPAQSVQLKSSWSSTSPLKSNQYLPPHQVEINIPSAAGVQAKTANFRAGNLLVRNYLPVEGNVKTGYVFEA